MELPKLSAPAQRALAGAGISSVEELAKFTEEEIRALHGIGPNAMKSLLAAMEIARVSFRE